MKQPEGYVVAGKEHLVCKLTKSQYGLKQATKVWNEKLHGTIIKLGFKQSTADPCLYSKQSERKTQYMVIYVDDILVADSNNQKIDETANGLEQEFELTRLGELTNYLGVNARKDSEGVYSIDQEQYIQKIFEWFGLEDAKISKIPMDTGYLKIIGDKKPMVNSDIYQKLIGALLYVATHTRPDIAASVSILSQRVKQPTETDWTEAKRVVRYLKGTKNLRLKLGGNTNGLIVYSDADWAEDTTDRKSHSEHLFLYNGGAIAWSCRKQTCTAWSSCEAEYIALAEASRELIWIRKLLEDFDETETKATKIYEDNQSAIKMVKSKEFRNRTKHINTKYHFVNDLVEKEVVDLQYCPTEEMTADMLTKPLQSVKLRKHREGCQLTDK
ncbi:retrovirus-related pol polyprotein from transposon tnt 1-94 [Lasius niger]|uniref:Retrovirus-related pol polyprotein from transposon tnt 1-94 n=1 Tax=Lasius niger TaxID=67767 RepID=A0A0J7K714_LASNI|nr:retrovirus-related pol polyprotein from transposon tnt 1-94 [Lasius niger]